MIVIILITIKKLTYLCWWAIVVVVCCVDYSLLVIKRLRSLGRKSCSITRVRRLLLPFWLLFGSINRLLLLLLLYYWWLTNLLLLILRTVKASIIVVIVIVILTLLDYWRRLNSLLAHWFAIIVLVVCCPTCCCLRVAWQSGLLPLLLCVSAWGWLGSCFACCFGLFSNGKSVSLIVFGRKKERDNNLQRSHV